MRFQYELQQIKGNLTKIRRLIIIARPVDLPPLKRDDAAETTTKKKLELPLFGKKRTFGLAKSKAAAIIAVDATSSSSSTNTNTTTTTTTIATSVESKTNTTNDQMDFVEEFDDDDTPNKESAAKAKDTDKCDKQHDDVNKMDHVNDEISVPDKKQPASMPNKITENKVKMESVVCDDINKTIDKDLTIQPPPTESMQHANVQSKESESESKVTAVNQTQHKSRSRNANKARRQRAHIDVDEGDEEKSPNKFADWLPPQNQSGDGITDLNTKFGY